MPQNDDLPLVSVIIPFFDSEKYIAAAIDSVRSQSYPYFECILVDDGSTDESWNIASRYRPSDRRIKLLKRPQDRPKGANACRNYGLEHATGELLIFLDADDLLADFCLEQRVNAVEKFPSFDCLIFSVRSFYSGPGHSIRYGGILNDDSGIDSRSLCLRKFLRYELPWTTSGPIWRRPFFIKSGGFDERFDRLQDPEFHTRALLVNALNYKRILNEPADSFHRESGAGKYERKEIRQAILNGFFLFFSKFFFLVRKEENKRAYLTDLKILLKKILIRIYQYRVSFTELKRYQPLLMQEGMISPIEKRGMKLLILLEGVKNKTRWVYPWRLIQKVILKVLFQ